eukprot:6190913-Alexandrium_andersonii.AAC.1
MGFPRDEDFDDEDYAASLLDPEGWLRHLEEQSGAEARSRQEEVREEELRQDIETAQELERE